MKYSNRNDGIIMQNDLNSCQQVSFDFDQLEVNLAELKPRLTIENVVSTIELGFRLNREFVLKHLNGAYKTKKFAAIIRPITNSTALIFETGSIVITGAKTEDESFRESMKHISDLQKIFVDADGVSLIDFGVITEKKCKIRNVVAKANVAFEVSLKALHRGERHCCDLNEETFAGAVYRMKDLNITLLIFASGNIVITGGDSVKKVMQAFNAIVSILQKYKKQSVIGFK